MFDTVSNKHQYIILLLLGLTIFWLGNNQMSLWDRDEPRYAGTARTMLETGDFIVPYFNDEFRFQKPVMTYWLIAFALKLFGDTGFAIRFFSGLCVTLGCLCICRMGDRMFGRPAGLIAALMTLLCPVVYMLGKLAIPDGPQFFFSCLCFWLLYESLDLQTGLKSQRCAFWFWIAFALTLLIKGPVIAGMVVATMLAYWIIARQPPTQFKLRWPLGVLITGLIAAPWFVAIGYVTNGAFYNQSVGVQLVGRVYQSFDGRLLLPGYYLGTAIVGFAPWIALALIALIRLRKEISQPGPIAYLVAWFVGAMVLLELFRSKQIHYFAPAYPALALLASGYLAPALRGEYEWQRDKHSRNICVAIGLLGIILAGMFAGIAAFGPATGMIAAATAACVALAGQLAAARFLHQQRLRRALTVQTVTLSLLFLLVSIGLLPALDSDRLTIEVAHQLTQEAEARNAEIAQHQLVEPSLVYYAKRPLPIYYNPADFERKVIGSRDELVSLLTDVEYERLDPEIKRRIEITKTWQGWVRMHADVVHLCRIHPVSANLATSDDEKLK